MDKITNKCDITNKSDNRSFNSALEKEKKLVTISQLSKEFIENSGKIIDYQKITDDARLLSEAKYIGFNLFEENGKDFTTVAMSGLPKHIQIASDLLGFNLIGKKWSQDEERIKKIRDQNITYFESLGNLSGAVIFPGVIKTLVRVFKIGQVVIVKIMKDGKQLGDFTMIMEQDMEFIYPDILEIYASMVGLYIEKRKSEGQYQKLFQEMLDGFALYEIVYDPLVRPIDYRYLGVNPAFEKMMGIQTEGIIGKTLIEIQADTEETMIESFSKVALTGESQFIEVYMTSLDKHFEVSIYQPKQYKVAAMFRDVTDRRNKETAFIYLSYHDYLTGLYNRRYFDEALERLKISENMPLTIMLGDVNGLKQINDVFGYLEGDKIIKKAAEVLETACSTEHIVARIGGDEFGIIMTHTDAIHAQIVLDEIKRLENLARFKVSSLYMSFGYGVSQDDQDTSQKIFTRAENAMYQVKIYERSSSRSQSIHIIMNTLFEKSEREMMHSKRVGEIAETIAVTMKYDDNFVNQIRTAGYLHDIGKIGIAEEILNKAGRLEDLEWEEIGKHPEKGWRILGHSEEYFELAEIILHHHEWWDGSGYPHKIGGAAIPVQARIIAVADAFDAMTEPRTYKQTMSKNEAVAELKKCAGTQFDPDVVTAFEKCVNLVLV